jgi:ABC-type sugar transport system ATPase subunit
MHDLPLRANLSVLDNIGVIPQYRDNHSYAEAARAAWDLLARCGYTDCADKRDPDLRSDERFVAKLCRAVMIGRPLIVIDRPGLLLPDDDYPPFLAQIMAKLEGSFRNYLVLDYVWNKPLYAPRPSQA